MQRTDPHYNRYGDLTLEGARQRYPRLIHEMQWAANLSETEAIGAILAVKRGVDYAGEAVDHYGGPIVTVEGALYRRRPPTERRVSRGKQLLDRVFRNGDQPLDFDWRGRVRRAINGYAFDLVNPDRCVLAYAFGMGFTDALHALRWCIGNERKNDDAFYGFELYGASGGIPAELCEVEIIELTRAWEQVVGVVQ